MRRGLRRSLPTVRKDSPLPPERLARSNSQAAGREVAQVINNLMPTTTSNTAMAVRSTLSRV